MTDYDYDFIPKPQRGNGIDSVPSICFKCKKEPPKQFESEYDFQRDNLLEVSFTGAYGMFVDPLFSYYLLHLCHECGHDLCDWLGIDPSNWHTHRPDTGQHADHHHDN